jgi:hypothetical protein
VALQSPASSSGAAGGFSSPSSEAFRSPTNAPPASDDTGVSVMYRIEITLGVTRLLKAANHCWGLILTLSADSRQAAREERRPCIHDNEQRERSGTA